LLLLRSQPITLLDDLI